MRYNAVEHIYSGELVQRRRLMRGKRLWPSECIGHYVSTYILDTARQHIKGDISINESCE